MAEYFEGVLYVEEDRAAKFVAVGKENGVKVLGGLNNALITKEEVQGAVKEIKEGNAAG